MVEKVQIDTEGIKKVLRHFRAEESIAEYVWNGFDAKAKEVRITFKEFGGLGAVSSITIEDDGHGIDRQVLASKFKPFLHSDKRYLNPLEKSRSVIHGKNGYGRLTFFCFATRAVWCTKFNDKDAVSEYEIEVKSDTLEDYSADKPSKDVKDKKTGTKVEFTGLRDITKDFILSTLAKYLQVEFGWFLELYKEKGLAIYINDKKLSYEEIVGDRETTIITHKKTGTEFSVSFIRWNEFLRDEYSRYYLVDSFGDEKYKGTTRLNNKSDEFYHSVYVKSDYFDTFTYDVSQSEKQGTLLGHSKSDEAYKYLEDEVTKYLRDKRRPFLKVLVDKKVEEFKREGVIPEPRTEWDGARNQELTEVVRGLYVIQPKIFTTASLDQKKILVRLFNTLLDTSERESILKIVDEVLGLDEGDKKDLLELLKVTKLSNIIRTTKLLKDRFVFIEQLKEAVFRKSLKINERDHLQKLLDPNFWVFGDEFSLVSTTEVKFEKALSAHRHLLTVDTKKIKVDHPDKNKEMDLFLCRQSTYIDTVENLVIEIKSPTVKLGMKEVNQVKTYQSVVMSTPECNGANMNWKFILIGNEFDKKGYVKGEIENAKVHGEKHKGLIHSVNNCKIYVRTWSDIFTEFECRHKFIQDKLRIDKNALSKDYGSAEALMAEALKDQTPIKKATSKIKKVS